MLYVFSAVDVAVEEVGVLCFETLQIFIGGVLPVDVRLYNLSLQGLPVSLTLNSHR